MNVMRVRRKPSRFEVVSVADILATAAGKQPWQDMPLWLNEQYRFGRLMIHSNDVTLSTNMGHMTGRHSDYILKRPDGTLQIITDADFLESYELEHEEHDYAAHEERPQDQAGNGQELRQG